MTTALLLLAVLVLILLNAFFVAAEFALVRVRRSRIEELAQQEGRRGGRATLMLSLLDDLSRYLAACQLGITLTSLGIGFLGEPAIGSILENLLGDGVPHWLSTAVSIGGAYLIATSLHITLGEQIPKIYSIERAEQTALRIARPLKLFSTVFRPMVVALNGASNWVLRRIGIIAIAGQRLGPDDAFHLFRPQPDARLR